MKHFTITGGLGYFSYSFLNLSIKSWQLPMYLSGLAGGDNHFLEVSAGGIFVFVSETVSSAFDSNLKENLSSSGVLGLVGVGYRYWPLTGGFHFRANVYYFFRQVGVIFPGLTFGYAFP
ncbi:MAG: hypothetical protein HY537_11545 [Deltaproteobacteria bacterium]|nr:hypothetical protein [Deltaproteobacteria bacterium]